jgi:hypothetical protein
MPTIAALRYREKARELREMAASALTETLRDQFTILAGQYEQLATSIESPSFQADGPVLSILA